MSKSSQVFTICNALVDVLLEISHEELAEIGIQKGIMHLVEAERQAHLLERFRNHKIHYELGGSGMNSARALAALNINTKFFGAVGNDAFGERILTRMSELGIGSKVAKVDASTGSCIVLITPDGERTMNTHLGASCHYHKDLVPHNDIATSEIFHFTGYQWSTDHQRAAIKEAIKVAKEAQTLISFDIADPFVVKLFAEDFRNAIKEYADIVFANAQEAHDLYGTSPEEAARLIAESGAIAVVKLGAEGALIRQGDEEVRIKAVPTSVIDTTGAGDMFAAGFLYGFLHQQDHGVSGKMAAELASGVIAEVGAKLPTTAINRIRLR